MQYNSENVNSQINFDEKINNFYATEEIQQIYIPLLIKQIQKSVNLVLLENGQVDESFRGYTNGSLHIKSEIDESGKIFLKIKFGSDIEFEYHPSTDVARQMPSRGNLLAKTRDFLI